MKVEYFVLGIIALILLMMYITKDEALKSDLSSNPSATVGNFTQLTGYTPGGSFLWISFVILGALLIITLIETEML